MEFQDRSLPLLRLLAGKKTLIIGHRGCCALAPENTLPSFERGLRAGADLVELDYHHGADGVPVVIHDRTLNRTTNARRLWRGRKLGVSSRTSAEIQTLDAGAWFSVDFHSAKVPLLSDALEWIISRGGIPLIEHKSGDAATCARLLRKHGWINRVVVISFFWNYLADFHSLEPRQVLGALGPPAKLSDGRKPGRLRRRFGRAALDEMSRTGASIAVWNRRVSRAGVELARRRGLRVWVYTVNNPRQARRLIDRRVDGIITDNPGEMRDALRPSEY